MSRGWLNVPMLLAACGGDAALLAEMCRTFRPRYQNSWQRSATLCVTAMPRAGELAHKCCSGLATFSAVSAISPDNWRISQSALSLRKPLPSCKNSKRESQDSLDRSRAYPLSNCKTRPGIPATATGPGDRKQHVCSQIEAKIVAGRRHGRCSNRSGKSASNTFRGRRPSIPWRLYCRFPEARKCDQVNPNRITGAAKHRDTADHRWRPHAPEERGADEQRGGQ